jgi:hypothetical protein
VPRVRRYVLDEVLGHEEGVIRPFSTLALGVFLGPG